MLVSILAISLWSRSQDAYGFVIFCN